MRKRVKRIIVAVLVVLAGTSLTGCGVWYDAWGRPHYGPRPHHHHHHHHQAPPPPPHHHHHF